jgi:glycogen operon protein
VTPVITKWATLEGAPTPQGASWVAAELAYNFSLYSRNATGVTLLLYDEQNHIDPAYVYCLHYLTNKSGRTWHCRIPAAEIPQARYYAYRVEGPYDPTTGQRFDPQKILLDPYAPAVFFPRGFSRRVAEAPGPNEGRAPLGVLPRPHPRFDWGDDPRPRHTHATIIYEMHVKGFTARPNSGVSAHKRGTFAGVIEKIPYLKELGVTVVELMPVYQYDPCEGNYWGYMPLHFFSPHQGYASASADGFDEFRAMVKALHAAGIEVILDVVYNHTTETDQTGPTYSYRGIDNSTYYLLEKHNRSNYRNDAGCGNVLRCAHPAVRTLIIESMRFWVEQMHIDGFRFDLASIFTRDNDGSVNLTDPGVIAEISTDAAFHNIRLIAEAWDISSYQLGRSFPGFSWLQWNGKFRDDIRAFVKSDRGKVLDLLRRLYGSDDLFPDDLFNAYRPYQSVNYITSHDGFCLYDLVAYNEKHNAANGHHNTDGPNDNFSWNCGWEGDVGVPASIMELRKRQIKNFCCLLMLSNGTPMLCAGDEFMNTQGGNNNPYNQDNETTWLNWDLLQKNQDIFRFFKLMIAFRKAHPSLGRSRYWRDDVSWYGVGSYPDTSQESHSLAFCLRGAAQQDDDIYVMINAFWEDLTFAIQDGPADKWRRVVDTSLPSPRDIVEPGHEVSVYGKHYTVKARSVVVLRSV